MVAESKRIRQAKGSKTRVVIECIALAESSCRLVASRKRASLKGGKNIKQHGRQKRKPQPNVQI